MAIKKHLILLGILGAITINPIDGAPFEFQSSLNTTSLNLFFQNATLKNVNRINCTKLIKDLRPDAWTNRIPLALCIDHTLKRAFYINYHSFFKKELIAIKHPDLNNPSDICATPQGDIFIIDTNAHQLFHFKVSPKENTLTFQNKYPIESPLRCETNEQNKLVITSKEKVTSFTIYNTILKENQAYNYILNQLLKDLMPTFVIDITLSRYNQLSILTDSTLVTLDASGQTIQKKPIQQPYTAIENSIYGDLFLLNSTKKTVDKFTKNLEPLQTLSIGGYFNKPPMDLTIYESHGYLVIAEPEYGLYYGMGTSIKNLAFNTLKGQPNKQISHINFTLTFPSKVQITLLNKNKEIVDNILTETTLMANNHSILWDPPPLTHKDYIIQVTASALYSLGNTTKKQIPYTTN